MLNQIKNILLKNEEGKFKLNQKASIFLFCLMLSTFFWFLSVLGKNYTAKLKFYINYEDFSSDFILTEAPTEFIEGEVFGSGYELLGEQLSLSRIKIDLSLKNAKSTAVPNRYFIDTRQLRNQLRSALDRDLQLNAILQDSIVFKTQKRLNKTIKIIPDLTLEFESGYALRGEVIYSPKQINISGPKSFIDTVEFITSVAKAISGIEDTMRLKMGLKMPENINGIKTSTTEIDVIIPAEKHTEKRIELPVQLQGNREFAIKTFPGQVTAVLLVPLSMYNQLTEAKLTAIAKFKSPDSSDKLKIEIIGVPKYADLIRVEPDRVEYIIRK